MPVRIFFYTQNLLLVFKSLLKAAVVFAEVEHSTYNFLTFLEQPYEAFILWKKFRCTKVKVYIMCYLNSKTEGF